MNDTNGQALKPGGLYSQAGPLGDTDLGPAVWFGSDGNFYDGELELPILEKITVPDGQSLVHLPGAWWVAMTELD